MQTNTGLIVAHRRQELGLSVGQLAVLSRHSEVELVAFEGGEADAIEPTCLSHLLILLGLSGNPLSTVARHRKQGLRMAAQNSSVSYRYQLSAQDLYSILVTGEVPDAMISNLVHFLEETPLPLVILAVEECGTTARERQVVWHNLKMLAKELRTSRAEIWC